MQDMRAYTSRQHGSPDFSTPHAQFFILLNLTKSSSRITMESNNYNYLPLNHDVGEIRLVVLLPDLFDNKIRVSLSHVVLPIPATSPERTIDMQGLQRTLPPGWEVLQTVEGRALFCQDRETSSWTHPDPDFNYVEEDWRSPSEDFGTIPYF